MNTLMLAVVLGGSRGAGGPTIPENAVVNEEGDPVVNDAGDYIVTED